MRSHSPIRAVVLALGLLICGSAPAYERDKTDVVALENGDRITGSILSLEYGILSVKTESVGTVAIEWHAVRSVISRYAFAIERNDGTKFYGTIDTEGTSLLVTGAKGEARVPLADVERVSRFSPTFWHRVNGMLAVGFSYAKASEISVGSVAFNSTYRSDRIEGTLDASADSTHSPASGTTSRDYISSRVMFLRQSRNFWAVVGSLERDQTVGIDNRLIGGAVVGRRFQQTPETELTGMVGLVGTQEWIAGNNGQQTSLESVLAVDWQVFRFVPLKTLLDWKVAVYPSLSESGRYRIGSDLSLTHKITSDLAIGLTGFWTYDSRPPDPTAAGTDYGLTFNLGYTFGE